MTSTADRSRRIASHLLSLGAVTFSPQRPFTWASGLRSPVYCDNRLTLSEPRVREAISEEFFGLIRENGIDCDVVGGIATAGIPHAAWLADRMRKPMIYVRGEAKAHGRRRRVEGALSEGDDVVLVEDLVSTGRSSIAAVTPVEEEGARVRAVLAIFTYALAGTAEAFERAGTALYALSSFPVLLEVAVESGIVSSTDHESLSSWHADPAAWSEQVAG